MDELLNSNNYNNKNDAFDASVTTTDNERCTTNQDESDSTENACRRSARISAAKESNAFKINYDEYYSFKRPPPSKNKNKTPKKTKTTTEPICECQRKFSMHSRKSSLPNAISSAIAEELIHSEVSCSKNEEIFKCVKMKSQSDNDGELKMKIKKCHNKKAKKKEEKVDNKACTNNNNSSTNNKNSAPKVANNVLKRKRQTSRKQFRHKDITLYKLGSGNKETLNKKEVIQSIFPRRPSLSSLPALIQTTNDSEESSTLNTHFGETRFSDSLHIAGAVENISSSTVLGNSQSKTEYPVHFQLNIRSAQNNVSTKKPEVPKYGPSNYSIESLTAATSGKHNLPIRIPETRCSIALPLHNSSAYGKFQAGRSVPTMTLNFPSGNMGKNVHTNAVTLSTNLSQSNDIGIQEKKGTVNSNSSAETVISSTCTAVSSHSLYLQNSNSNVSFSESACAQSNLYVPTVSSSTNYSIPSSCVPLPDEPLNTTNATYITKKLKRKALHSDHDTNKQFKANQYMQNVTPPQSTYNYSQNNLHSPSFVSNNQTSYPTYESYNGNPSAFIYSNCKRPPYDSNLVTTSNSKQSPQSTNQSLLPPTNAGNEVTSAPMTVVAPESKYVMPKFKITVNPESKSIKCEEVTDTGLPISTYEAEASLQLKKFKKEDVLINPEENNVDKAVHGKNENGLDSNTINVPTKVERIEERPLPCSSPLVISDSDSEDEPVKINALYESKDEDSKTSLKLAPALNDNKLSNSTQSHVLQTLNTLTYVVNEIIDKTGDNMPKQDKDLLHKLLEGVSQKPKLSSMNKSADVVVKDEPCIDLVSDSESEDIVTDSHGTLDLSMKKVPGVREKVQKPKEVDVKPKADVVQKDKSYENSVLNLSKTSKLFSDNDNTVINLSTRNRTDQVESSGLNERPTMPALPTCTSSVSSVTNVFSATLATLNLGKTSSLVATDYNTQKQSQGMQMPKTKVDLKLPKLQLLNSVSSSTQNSSKTNIWTNQCAPPRRASCTLENKPAEIAHRRSTVDATRYQSYQTLSNKVEHGVVKQPELFGTIGKQFNNAWNKNAQEEYFNSHYHSAASMHYDKSTALPTQTAVYPQFVGPNGNNYIVPNNTSTRLDYNFNPPKNSTNLQSTIPIKGRVDYLPNNARTGIWDQYRSDNSTTKQVDNRINNLLGYTHKRQDSLYKMTDMQHKLNGPPSKPILTKPSSELPKPSHQSHYTKKNFAKSTSVTAKDAPSKKTFPVQDSKLGALLSNTEKRSNDYISHKNYNVDPQTFKSNLSPDYGYFSPLPVYAQITEIAHSADVVQKPTALSKSLELVSTSAFLGIPAETSNSQNALDKLYSPVLQPKDQEKVLKILPKLHFQNTLTPEQYIAEVEILQRDGCPLHFLKFYSYITKKQIASNQSPVGFRIFLEFQNAGKLLEFEKAFIIYRKKCENERRALL